MKNTNTVLSNIVRGFERLEGAEVGTFRYRIEHEANNVTVKVFGEEFEREVRGTTLAAAEAELGAFGSREVDERIARLEAQLAAEKELRALFNGRRLNPNGAKPGRKPGVKSLTETRSEVSALAAKENRVASKLSREKVAEALGVAAATVANWEAADKPVPLAYAQFLGLVVPERSLEPVAVVADVSSEQDEALEATG